MRYAIFLAFTTTLWGAAPDPRTILIGDQVVEYVDQGGYAVVHGDIIAGSVAELEAAGRGDAGSLRRIAPALFRKPAASFAATPLWTGNTVPYIVDPDVPNQQIIPAAIAEWQSRIPLKLVPRTTERNYVRFVKVSGDFACASALGMRGGEQLLQVTDVCSTGNMIHELGHTFGLLHEQERLDRNQFVAVLYANIDKRFISAYDQSSASKDLGYYDYDSIMHYGPSGFSRIGLTTLETVPVGIPIGQRIVPSAGDVDQLTRLYGVTPTATTVTTLPAGLNMTVDGQTVKSPQSFNWTPGSPHTIAVDGKQGTDPLYSFVRWTDDGAAEHQFIASADRTAVGAVFQLRHKASAQVSSGSGKVSIRPASDGGYYPDRQSVLLEAVPNSGSGFIRWTGTTNLGANHFGVSVSKAVLDISVANALYGATFTTAPLTTITSDPPGRTVLVDGTTYITPVKMPLAAGSTHTVSLVATQLDGNNTVRYKFSGWTDGTSEASRNFTGGTSITANFTTQYLLTTNVAGTGTITVSPSSPDGFYDAGTPVTLSAAGQNIRYWVGDAAGGANSQTLQMDEQKAATAVFGTTLPFRPLSSASYLANPLFTNTGTMVAPLEIVTLFGANVGPANLVLGQVDGSGKLGTTVGGTRVLFDGVAAPILYASATQTGVVVPAGAGQGGSTILTVERNGTLVGGSLSVGMVTSKPALFTANSSGVGQVAAFNQDGSLNSPSNPAEPGSVITLYGTGAGLMDRALVDGQIMDGNLARPKGAVAVKFGKLAGKIYYAGTAPFLVNGALQVNVGIPAEALPGAIAVQISVGTWTSPPGTTVSIR